METEVSQPVAAEVGTRVGIAERTGQSDVRERVCAVESSTAKPTRTVVVQGVVVRRAVLQDVSIDRRGDVV